MNCRWVVVGLGNPGAKYIKTRHNIGFRVIDLISDKHNIQLEERQLYIIGKGDFNENEIFLLKPLTFMNKSGIAVKRLISRVFVPSERLIVIHDDLDIDVGRIKIRKKGSSGGHRGVESIIQEIGTDDFIRVKIGIGRDRNIQVEDYVLSSFKPSEEEIIDRAVVNASSAVLDIITKGIEKAMNIYNKSNRQENE